QPEILAYLQHVADRYDLRRDIWFGTRVTAAVWDEAGRVWRLSTSAGDKVSCRSYVMASGCLSLPKTPDVEGAGGFGGEVYLTGMWPHQRVDFSGKKVAVVGTGSSGIQAIPEIARQAAHLTVFQRTANFSAPAHNGPPSPDRLAWLAEDRDGYREAARWSRGGMPAELTDVSGVTAPEDVRKQRFEEAWRTGELFAILGVFSDQGINPVANEIVAEMIREKIRASVTDPYTADMLCPKDHPFGTKRPCLDTGYFATFNLPHVRLVDLRRTPITAITEAGIDTVDDAFELDAIVFATGFDAMTGPLVSVDITGANGVTLKDKWALGPATYLGLMTSGFPNLFMITGPQSPSVLSNMVVSIEQHVDRVTDCLQRLRAEGLDRIEPTPVAEAGWVRHNQDCAEITLHPRANSWYMGANVPGKPKVFLPYIGGVDAYRRACQEVAENDLMGFMLDGPAGARCNDGVIRRVQPDVAMVLELVASLGLPAMETMDAAKARAFSEATAATMPPGPAVGELTDGVLPGPAGDLAYRLYRPPSAGPHPLIAYFHGGGWVLGSEHADEPFCRDLCVRTGVVIVSVNYRHAPEDRFPAAVNDAFAAVQWIAANDAKLGGIPGHLAVAGWSAGGNLAAVTCQLARDAGGPDITGQLLLTPVTDGDLGRASYIENGENFILTAALMRWFWDHYADEADRAHPQAAPLRGTLTGLPPTVVVTAEFDPLRDEGDAYAEALADAGVPVQQIRARGHTHTSMTMVDAVISGAPVRAEMAAALNSFLLVPVQA
ncbi:MAG TPA: alpha/beta hydrolase fold domain-containing protein, partial [Streptosporangiaceae bacterium]